MLKLDTIRKKKRYSRSREGEGEEGGGEEGCGRVVAVLMC